MWKKRCSENARRDLLLDRDFWDVPSDHARKVGVMVVVRTAMESYNGYIRMGCPGYVGFEDGLGSLKNAGLV